LTGIAPLGIFLPIKDVIGSETRPSAMRFWNDSSVWGCDVDTGGRESGGDAGAFGDASSAIVVAGAGVGSVRPSAALVAWSGERAAARTVEFLMAGIHNPHTRRAYHRAARRFLAWCNARALTLPEVNSPDVALYIQELGGMLAPLSVKQHLAALKHWFDWLVTGHVLEVNPAHAVRGPRYSQNTGKTPVLEKDEARALLDSLPGELAALFATETTAAALPLPLSLAEAARRKAEQARRDALRVVALRDRALIAVMLFSFARIGAVVDMKVREYRGAGTARATLLLHEKNGRDHVVPAHHVAAEYLDAYIAAAGLADRPDAPLWQNAPGHARTLTGEPLSERGALDIVKRRCRAVGLPPEICNHSFRATGITLHQDAKGDLEAARQLAGHADVRTTQLYNRSGDKKQRAEVERVQL
jgi:site-specific recombinase XerD